MKGDRLCVYLPNRIELIDLYLACVKLGVMFVPVNILYRDREIDHIRRDAEPMPPLQPNATIPVPAPTAPSLQTEQPRS